MQQDPRVIVALDYSEIEPLRAVVKQLSPSLCRVKIGNILFTRYGPALVEELMQQGFDIFLDLKFHDIPATVAGACRSAAELGVWMTNLHVATGERAMVAAREAIQDFSTPPLLIGVTVLTSLLQQDLQILTIETDVETLVLQLATLAKQVGLDGVVCSSQEAALLRSVLGEDFLLVTPGIRLTQKIEDDQRRIMTPDAAMAAGASYLVIGRPITHADNPAQVLEEINMMLQA